MANWPTQTISDQGVTPTYNAASAGGDTITPGDRTFLHIKNGGASAVTMTATPTEQVGGLSLQPLTVNVPATSEVCVGPFAASLFRNQSDGYAHISWSAVTSVTFAVLTL